MSPHGFNFYAEYQAARSQARRAAASAELLAQPYWYCPACGGETPHDYAEPGEYEIYTCTVCQHVTSYRVR